MILAELAELVGGVVPVETGMFTGIAPDEYAVLTPLIDDFPLFADNEPLADVSEVRISLFTTGNYLGLKATLTDLLLGNGFIITGRRYLGVDSGYHHYGFDVAKHYYLKEK
ncbi:MAG: hypothetical protein FWG25_11045 [Promicromonosporaceae bacterium]|nr:hypothetical protein [Promicromonosporaceae bacterium]